MAAHPRRKPTERDIVGLKYFDRLMPLLQRLHRLGYVTTEWRTPPEGRRRKYYVLTDDGRSALAEQRRQWEAVTRALNDIWPGSNGRLACAEPTESATQTRA